MINYSAMSDPDMNPQFRRRWTEPPKRNRRPEDQSGTAANSQKGRTVNTTIMDSLSIQLELDWRRGRAVA